MTSHKSAWDRLDVTQRLLRSNPMHANPLKTREDLKTAVLAFYEPLKPYYSDGHARLRFSTGAAHFDQDAAEMEAFVRPLWGIVPMLAGGFGFDDLHHFVEGLGHGMDKDHPEYWGDVGRYDQRMVEMAGIALALLLAPQHFWDPMSAATKDKVEDWLLSINRHDMPDNNWLFFRILVNLALRNVGRNWSEELVLQGLERIETFYLGDGYYRDGEWKQRDYYLPMALHFYGLMLARLCADLYPDHARRYRERARRFAQDFRHWFAEDGAAIPFGRSLTYRFAQGAFWAAAAFAGEEVLPWGEIKGLLLRHLRWWSEQPFAERDGIISIGYCYPNLLMSEAYNSPGSPYWALKIFLVLALPDSHPFWAADEVDLPEPDDVPILVPSAGFAIRRSVGDAVILTGGQDGHEHRAYDAKYGRFAYSSAFTFSVKSDTTVPDYPDRSAVDCGLMASRDGQSWISRGQILEAGVKDGLVWGAWQPDDRLRIETWLAFAGPGWHVRLHHIASQDPIWLAESGFAIDRTDERRPDFAAGLAVLPDRVLLRNADATSAICDLSGSRDGSIVRAAPNTNLRFPRTLFPRLDGTLPAGNHVLMTAVLGLPKRVEDLPEIAIPDAITKRAQALKL